jgi:hypothetical protein
LLQKKGGLKVWEHKAPRDGRIMKKLKLYLPKKERILKEYLKVLVKTEKTGRDISKFVIQSYTAFEIQSLV